MADKKYQVVAWVPFYTIISATTPAAAVQKARRRYLGQGMAPDPHHAWRMQTDNTLQQVRAVLLGKQA